MLAANYMFITLYVNNQTGNCLLDRLPGDLISMFSAVVIKHVGKGVFFGDGHRLHGSAIRGAFFSSFLEIGVSFSLFIQFLCMIHQNIFTFSHFSNANFCILEHF